MGTLRDFISGYQHIYLANDDHTDYMWTASEVQYWFRS